MTFLSLVNTFSKKGKNRLCHKSSLWPLKIGLSLFQCLVDWAGGRQSSLVAVVEEKLPALKMMKRLWVLMLPSVSLANFFPGTGCGTDTEIRYSDTIPDNPAERNCLLITNAKEYQDFITLRPRMCSIGSPSFAQDV